MSPLDFIRSPLSWVVGMSQFGATMSAAPNFAWDLVVRRYTALPVSQRPMLKLHQVAFQISGAERVMSCSPRLTHRRSDYDTIGRRPAVVYHANLTISEPGRHATTGAGVVGRSILGGGEKGSEQKDVDQWRG